MSDKLQVVQGRHDRILVAGISRSGSSWVIDALRTTPGTKCWYEPDYIDSDPNGKKPAGSTGFGPYPVIEPGSDGGVHKALWDVVYNGKIPVTRRGNILIPLAKPFLKLPKPILHPLFKLGTKVFTAVPGVAPERVAVKSVFTAFCIEWIVETYDPKVVMLQRNPLSIVSSWRDLKTPVFDLATRPHVLENYRDRYEGDPPKESDSELTKIAWAVGLITTVMSDSLERHPEWLLVNHEDLCIDSPAKFKTLCERLEIPWSESVTEFLKRSNRPGEGLETKRITEEQVDKWKKKLNSEEVEEITEVLNRFPRKGWVRIPSERSG